MGNAALSFKSNIPFDWSRQAKHGYGLTSGLIMTVALNIYPRSYNSNDGNYNRCPHCSSTIWHQTVPPWHRRCDLKHSALVWLIKRLLLTCLTRSYSKHCRVTNLLKLAWKISVSPHLCDFSLWTASLLYPQCYTPKKTQKKRVTHTHWTEAKLADNNKQPEIHVGSETLLAALCLQNARSSVSL